MAAPTTSMVNVVVVVVVVVVEAVPFLLCVVGKQLVDPAFVLFHPEGQYRHPPMFVSFKTWEYRPAGQDWQRVDVALEYWPVPQTVHDDAPVVSVLYFPAAHTASQCS